MDAGTICNGCREPSSLEILQFANESLLGKGVLNALRAADDDSEEASAALDSPSKLTKARALRPPSLVCGVRALRRSWFASARPASLVVCVYAPSVTLAVCVCVCVCVCCG